mmetsp:Transcript_63985/g.101489  ORF Transcript_63985/g.101489 Transcript_63985/m.101489 type:complete len:101 (+) Transcript_63985:434-736(+)
MVDGFEGYVPVLARIACISHVSSAQIDEGIFCGFGLSDALARDEVVFFSFSQYANALASRSAQKCSRSFAFVVMPTPKKSGSLSGVFGGYAMYPIYEKSR